MSNDDSTPKPPVPAFLAEAYTDPETGRTEHSLHGPTCERTRVAYEADQRGEDLGTALRRHDTKCTGKPAQVASKAYRDNWESIFGARQPVGQA